MTKYKIFLDANVWFSAAMSPQGGSFLICRLAEAGLIQAFANNHVLEEAERNLLLKALKKLNDYYRLIKTAAPKISTISPNPVLVKKLDGLLPAKDMPVLAGALDAEADFLVSLDKKHILQPKLKNLDWPFQILSTKEFFKIFRKGFKKL
ncbi:MAG: putative toxin-antitoxin system toxin component, PIN family [Patescibacteria group bacterium]